jgi:hypothetical protein
MPKEKRRRVYQTALTSIDGVSFSASGLRWITNPNYGTAPILIKNTQTIIDYGYAQLAVSATEHNKLAAIGNMCRQLELLHPFRDANYRSVVILVLTKMLVDHHLSPTYLEHPYFFDGARSIVDIVNAIIRGQAEFQADKTKRVNRPDQGL